jgi:hypothetical protein
LGIRPAPAENKNADSQAVNYNSGKASGERL